ncbi:cobyrinic acid ac-diamide synthase [Leptolyngbya sp. Heron Island J]|nr:cobyrinic acid ac-diamide synthase [Leptolyngbya sp. Heron Island J]
MSRIIAFFNQSGGVGKTTLTMNIGYQLADLGRKVLLVDMDPQGSLTAFMGLEPMDLETTIYDAVVHQNELMLYQDLHGMDLAPSSIELCRAEMELAAALMREQRLKNALASASESYDFILIDCPPSLGILSVMSLVTATHVMIPIQTEFKALKGTELLVRTILEIMQVANKKLKIAGMVPTMFDGRTTQANQSLESIKAIAEQVGPIMPTIPRKTDFANASQAQMPLALYAPQSPAVSVLKEIAVKMDTL